MFENYKDKNGNYSSIKLQKFPKAEKEKLFKKFGTESLIEAMFLESTNITVPICKWCKLNRCSFKRSHYSDWCSVKCGASGSAKRGADSHLSKPETRIKIKETLIEKYGVDNPQKIESVKEQTRKTCESNWGASSWLGSEQGKKASKEGMLAKYGVTHTAKIEGATAPRNIQMAWLKKRIPTIKTAVPLFELNDWKGSKFKHQFKCNTCQGAFDGWLKDGHDPRCMTCWPITISSPQKMVMEALNSWGHFDFEVNDRKVLNGLEIDILLHDKKIGIEINGCYWHANKEPKYHLNKSELAATKGYRLIHVFEDEILDGSIFGRLKAIFAPDKGIAARKLELVVLKPKEAREFLSEFHSYGTGPGAKHYVGLKDADGVLHAVMSFCASRWNKSTQFELLRFATRGTVVGAAGRLFNFFVKKFNPESVLSYSERRWNLNSAVYSQIGFVLDGITPIDYWYVGNITRQIRESRLKYQAHKLRSGPEDKRTEKELAESIGLSRIYGCGNLRWIWRAEVHRIEK